MGKHYCNTVDTVQGRTSLGFLIGLFVKKKKKLNRVSSAPLRRFIRVCKTIAHGPSIEATVESSVLIRHDIGDLSRVLESLPLGRSSGVV